MAEMGEETPPENHDPELDSLIKKEI